MEFTVIDLAILGMIIGFGIAGSYFGAIKFAGPSAIIFTFVAMFYTYPSFSDRFGADSPSQFLLYLLFGFVALIVFALTTLVIHRTVEVIGLRFFNRLLGTVTGLITGAFIAGTAVWAFQTYSDPQGLALFEDSMLAAAILNFFYEVMGFFQRLLPDSEPPVQEDVPWWRRPLW